MLNKFEIVSNPYEQHLRQIKDNDKLAVAVSFEHLKNEEQITRLNLFCFESPNHIYEYPLKILTSKNFQFLCELNGFIEMVSETGFIVKWLKGYKFEPILESETLLQFMEIKLEMFSVFIVICGSLCVIASLVAALEITAHKKVQMKTVTKFWRIVEMILNPYRYLLFKFAVDMMKKENRKKFLKNRKKQLAKIKVQK